MTLDYQRSSPGRLGRYVDAALEVLQDVLGNSTARERRRLLALPRYTAGSSLLLGEAIFYADPWTFVYGCEEIFGDEVYRFQAKDDRPRIIDCGANIGLSARYFCQLYPQCRLTAFEPDPDIYAILLKNTDHLENVDAQQAAVWTEDGTASFCCEGGYSGHLSAVSEGAKEQWVPCRSLCRLLQEEARVDFLKLDVEGAEVEVLSDCFEQLACVDHLFIEYHSLRRQPQRLAELLQLLTQAGFRYAITGVFASRHPFVAVDELAGMDLQLNLFAFRETR